MAITLVPPTELSYSVEDALTRPFPRFQPTGNPAARGGGYPHWGTELLSTVDVTIPTHHDPEHPYYAMSLSVTLDITQKYVRTAVPGDYIASGYGLHSAEAALQGNELWQDAVTQTYSDLGGGAEVPYVLPTSPHYRLPLWHRPGARLYEAPYHLRRLTRARVSFPVDPPAAMTPGPTPPDYSIDEEHIGDPVSGLPYWYIDGLYWAEWIDVTGEGEFGGVPNRFEAIVGTPPVPIPRFFTDDDGWLLPVNAMSKMTMRLTPYDDIWINAAYLKIAAYFWREDGLPQIPGAVTPGDYRNGVRSRENVVGARGSV